MVEDRFVEQVLQPGMVASVQVASLERDRTVQFGVLRQKHLAYAAGTQVPRDPVMRDHLAGEGMGNCPTTSGSSNR